MNELVKKAKLFAIKTHFNTNHKYDDKEYAYHLYEVYKIAILFQDLIQEDIDNILSACWLHDIIEDCRLNYNDIKHEFNERIAELVYAVTTEKGKTRKERANDKYYYEMTLVDGAVFVKLCDRLTNTIYSYNTKSSMFNKYKKEYKYFKEMLYKEEYKEMFDELEKYYYNIL